MKHVGWVITSMTAGFVLAVLVVVPASQEIIMEDDPRWDCATMGNRVCGTPDGYLRCLEAMDAAGLAPELCEPLNG